MLKKLITAAAALALSVSVMTAGQSALKTDAYTYTSEIGYDLDGDYYNDVYYNVIFDTATKTCSLDGIYSYDTTVSSLKIPETFSDWSEDYWDDETGDYISVEYKLTGIKSGDYNIGNFTTVEIPYTVTSIADKSIGYYLYEDWEWDYDTWEEEYFSEIRKYDVNFKVTKNTAAETYAKNNSFSYTTLSNISAATVTVPSQVYTGGSLKPTPTVKLDGKTLAMGRDYTISYTNNVNAGTATLSITGIGEYRGKKSQTFTIAPKSASNAIVTAITDKNYTGSAIKPAVTVRLNGALLQNSRDYTVTYSNNVNIGTATATITFKGNYTGTVKKTFKIKVGDIKNLRSTKTTQKSVKLQWTKTKCDTYNIYRYSTNKKKYVYIGQTKNSYYIDKNLTQATKYSYQVKAVIKGKSGKLSNCSAVTVVKAPTIKASTLNKAVKLNWSKNSKATGYQIFRRAEDGGYYYYWLDYYVDTWSMTKLKTIKGASTTTFTNKNLSNSKKYEYAVRAYVKIDGKNYYSELSKGVSSTSAESRLNAATLKSHTSFKTYNRQGKKATSWTTTLTSSDIKILKNFAKTHFKSSMTRAQKLQVTIDWINKKVKYAKGNDWNEIAGLTYCDAIFNHKKGQCAQYNGALISMMVYLGYDANLVQGFRGTDAAHWQHFWGEVKICGQTYLMETGNFGDSGDWSFNCIKYSETTGYLTYC